MSPVATVHDVIPTRREVREVHYRDLYGRLLWVEPGSADMPWTPAARMVRQGVRFTVVGIALVDDVKHVNLWEWS
jgi:hypothetical protein